MASSTAFVHFPLVCITKPANPGISSSKVESGSLPSLSSCPTVVPPSPSLSHEDRDTGTNDLLVNPFQMQEGGSKQQKKKKVRPRTFISLCKSAQHKMRSFFFPPQPHQMPRAASTSQPPLSQAPVSQYAFLKRRLNRLPNLATYDPSTHSGIREIG